MTSINNDYKTSHIYNGKIVNKNNKNVNKRIFDSNKTVYVNQLFNNIYYSTNNSQKKNKKYKNIDYSNAFPISRSSNNQNNSLGKVNALTTKAKNNNEKGTILFKISSSIKLKGLRNEIKVSKNKNINSIKKNKVINKVINPNIIWNKSIDDAYENLKRKKAINKTNDVIIKELSKNKMNKTIKILNNTNKEINHISAKNLKMKTPVNISNIHNYLHYFKKNNKKNSYYETPLSNSLDIKKNKNSTFQLNKTLKLNRQKPLGLKRQKISNYLNILGTLSNFGENYNITDVNNKEKIKEKYADISNKEYYKKNEKYSNSEKYLSSNNFSPTESESYNFLYFNINNYGINNDFIKKKVINEKKSNKKCHIIKYYHFCQKIPIIRYKNSFFIKNKHKKIISSFTFNSSFEQGYPLKSNDNINEFSMSFGIKNYETDRNNNDNIINTNKDKIENYNEEFPKEFSEKLNPLIIEQNIKEKI